MATKIVSANGVYDLSGITTLKDLKDEIKFLKDSIKNEEDYFKKKVRILPHETLKLSAEAFLPSFLNKLIANKAWKLFMNSAGMFANPFSSKFGFKKSIVGSAKKLGLAALMKSAYGLWANRNKSKNKPLKVVPARIKPATVITTEKKSK